MNCSLFSSDILQRSLTKYFLAVPIVQSTMLDTTLTVKVLFLILIFGYKLISCAYATAEKDLVQHE